MSIAAYNITDLLSSTQRPDHPQALRTEPLMTSKTRQPRTSTRAERTAACRGCRSAREFARRFGNRGNPDRERLTARLAAHALRPLALELTKHDAADLAGERLRQVGD